MLILQELLTDFTAVCYTQANWGAIAGAANVRLFVYGSEFAKGTNGLGGAISIEPTFTQFSVIDLLS